jgi:anti-sigma B factor antagonist
MSCQITSSIVSGKVVVDLAGRFCFLELTLPDQIQKLLEEGNNQFVLDLSNLSYLDSFGLGQFICVWNSIQQAGGNMKLLRPPMHVQKLLQITKLDTVFSITNE